MKRQVFAFAFMSLFIHEASFASTRLYRQGDRLVMESDTCTNLSASVGTVSEWSSKFDGTLGEPVFFDESEKGCSADVASIFPVGLRERLYKDVGPICYALPLYLAKLIPQPRTVFSKEMKSWLDSTVCRKLSSQENLQAGDIGTVGFWGGGLDHAFTYLSREIIFETDAVTEWHATSLDDALAAYGVNIDCLDRFKRAGDCSISNSDEERVSFYRCSPRN